MMGFRSHGIVGAASVEKKEDARARLRRVVRGLICSGRGLSFGVGLLVGLAIASVARELAYIDRHRIVAPLDQAELVVRQDPKGHGGFGAPRSGNRRHRGVDIEAPLGSPVKAIKSGWVVAIGTHLGLGRFVEMDHVGGLESLYAHLDAINVDVEDRIRQGQMIGTVGKTGNARHRLIKPHLHLEISRAGEPQDPASFSLELVEARSDPSDAPAHGGKSP